MSYGTDALAEDLAAIGQVAGAALEAAYPGIQTQRFPGYWTVSLPLLHGAAGVGSGPTLKEAIKAAQGIDA